MPTHDGDYWIDDDGCLAYGHGDDYETIAVFITKDKTHRDVIAASRAMLRALYSTRETLEWLEFFGHMPQASKALPQVRGSIQMAEGK